MHLIESCQQQEGQQRYLKKDKKEKAMEDIQAIKDSEFFQKAF